MSELGKVIDRLENCFSGALRPEPPKVSAVEQPDKIQRIEVKAPIADALDNVVERLRGTEHRIESLIQRSEV